MGSSLISRNHPRSDVSNNSLYGTVNSNLQGMDRSSGLLNVANNYFFGSPALYASGCAYCPDRVARSINYSLPDLIPAAPTFVRPKPYTAGRASLRNNCFEQYANPPSPSFPPPSTPASRYNPLFTTPSSTGSCGWMEQQRTAEDCSSFCTVSDNGPCDGHGDCLPVWAFPPNSTAVRAAEGGVQAGSVTRGGLVLFTCNCSKGYYTVAVNGSVTCSLTPPPGDHSRVGSSCGAAFTV